MNTEVLSVSLMDETDLEALNDDLVEIVRETMQPAHASLWLRPDTAAPKGETKQSRGRLLLDEDDQSCLAK